MRYAINGPEYDTPMFVGPTTTVLIGSTPRTGSTLLARGLLGTGRCGVPHEYLNQVHIGELGQRTGATSLPDYIAWLRRHRTTPNGVFCVKAHHADVTEHVLRPGHDMARLFGPMRAVWIERHDRVRQAVSLVRAHQTGQWSVGQPVHRAPAYHYDFILSALQSIDRGHRGWRALFTRLGLSPVRVTYRQVADAYEATVLGVAAALGLGRPDELNVPPRAQKKLASEESEAWVVRFRTEATAAGVPAALLGRPEPS
jgi:LPS sulfotransferase NodH